MIANGSYSNIFTNTYRTLDMLKALYLVVWGLLRWTMNTNYPARQKAVSATTELELDCYRRAERRGNICLFVFFSSSLPTINWSDFGDLILYIKEKLTVLLQPPLTDYLPGFVLSFPTSMSFYPQMRQFRNRMTAVSLPSGSLSTIYCLERLDSGLYFPVLNIFKSIFSCV